MSSWPAFGAGMIVGMLFYLFPACGGGSSGGEASTPPPAPAPVADTLDHYAPPLFGHPSHGVVVGLADHARVYAEWSAVPGSDGWCGVAPCAQQEFLTLKSCGAAIYSYGTFADAVPAAVIDRQTQNGVTIDLAQACPGRPGSGLPFLLPASGTLLIEQWGWLTDLSGRADRPYYWYSKYTFGINMGNPCWQGGGSAIRAAYDQEEVWWDPAAGWVRGHALSVGQLPWFNGEPQEIVVVPENHNYWGRDAGALWRGTDNGVELCLMNS